MVANANTITIWILCNDLSFLGGFSTKFHQFYYIEYLLQINKLMPQTT